MILYIDDFWIFSKDKEIIDTLFKNLSKTFNLTNEGDVRSYLGMNVIKDTNGPITMSQPAITKKILNILGICNESKKHDTPENVISTTDVDENERK